MKVAIVGGGIMGCAVALELRLRGASVTLLERALPGVEASSAAAGMLGAQLESHQPGPMVDMLVNARDGYGDWVRRLEVRTGISVGYRVCGVLRVARSEQDCLQLASNVEWQRKKGLRADFVEGTRVREIEPTLAGEILGAAHFPDDAQVEPRRLLRALIAANASVGVQVQSGVTVRKLLIVAGRCEGVVHDFGEERADATILAAGSWSALVPGAPTDVEGVRPARGQMVALEQRAPSLSCIVASHGVYVVPRGDGRVVCGSTLEFVGYRKEVTAGGVLGILDEALRVVPTLAEAEIRSVWSNFRPHSVGERPLIGPSSIPGLFLATGHHRNGILLANLTADRVADAVMGTKHRMADLD